MESLPVRRLRLVAMSMLAVSAATGAIAFALAPRGGTRAVAALDGHGGGKTRGAPSEGLTRTIAYEWPARFHEDEPAVVSVRFHDPACAQNAAGDERQASASADLAERDVTVTLIAEGFRVAAREKRIVLRQCDQSLAWDVVPERGPRHVLAFRFETVLGDATVRPSRFEVPVTGALFLPSSVLYHGASGLSAVSAVLGLSGMFATLRQFVSKLRAKLSAASSNPVR